MTAYTDLKIRFAQAKRLQDAKEILSLDPSTEVQQKNLADTRYTLLKDPRVAELLSVAEASSASLGIQDRRNLSLMRREWVHTAMLPADLAAERARIEIEGQNLHYANYKAGDWSMMKDHYARSFAIAREAGEAKKEALGVSTAYEALLDEYSTEVRQDRLDTVFSFIDQSIPQRLPTVLERQKKQTPPLKVVGSFPVTGQYELNTRIARELGFDFKRGQMIVNDTWFTVGTRDEAYITTGFDEDDILYGLIQHEAGHGRYLQGLPAAWREQPAGNVMGLAVHEMMAMIVECHAARTPKFLGFIAENARQIFNRAADPSLTAENLLALHSRSEPSFIRTMADELTYPLHLTLRYALERDIMAGRLDVKHDLPEAWNEGFRQRLGLTPPDPSKGCMQDVHWPSGMIGYFPDYVLGRMGAAQIYQAACAASPAIADGDGKALHRWLRENIYSKGSLLSFDDLFMKATGEKLGPQALDAHLTRRFPT